MKEVNRNLVEIVAQMKEINRNLMRLYSNGMFEIHNDISDLSKTIDDALTITGYDLSRSIEDLSVCNNNYSSHDVLDIIEELSNKIEEKSYSHNKGLSVDNYNVNIREMIEAVNEMKKEIINGSWSRS